MIDQFQVPLIRKSVATAPKPQATPPKEKPITNKIEFEKIHASEYIRKIDSTLPWNKVKLVGYGFIALIGNCLAFFVFPVYLLAIFANREMYQDWFVKKRTSEEILKIKQLKTKQLLKEIFASLKFRAYWYFFLLLLWLFVGPINVLWAMWNLILYVFEFPSDN